jgi:hypothetical protein
MGRKSLCCVCGRRRRLVAGGRRRRELAAGQLLVLSSVAPTQEPPLGWVWARAVYVRTRRAPGRERRARSNLLGASRRVDRGHLLTLLLAACDCEQRRNAPNRCFALLKPDGEAASWSVPRWSLATVPASGSRAAETGFCPSGISEYVWALILGCPFMLEHRPQNRCPEDVEIPSYYRVAASFYPWPKIKAAPVNTPHHSLPL